MDNFAGFERRRVVDDLYYVTFTEYDPALPVSGVAFRTPHVEWPIARVVSEAGLTQCHVAETEKYAHVTYFFNGGREAPFDGEERIQFERDDLHRETRRTLGSRLGLRTVYDPAGRVIQTALQREKAPMPMLMPPYGGAASVSASTRG